MPETLTSYERAFLHRIQPKLDVLQRINTSEIRDVDMKAFYSLTARHLLVPDGEYRYRVTPDALNALAAAEETAKRLAVEDHRQFVKDEVEDKRYRQTARRSWWQFWLGLLIGWILGGFTFPTFWNFVFSIFQKSPT